MKNQLGLSLILEFLSKINMEATSSILKYETQNRSILGRPELLEFFGGLPTAYVTPPC